MSNYTSVLGEYITGLIAQKRACGYRYENEAYILASFDHLCVDHGHTEPTITRDLVMKWAFQRPSEGKNHRNGRVSIVRQLALYMRSLGIEAYVPGHFASGTNPVPHIFTKPQLQSFFAAVDAYDPARRALRRLIPTYQVLFRLFYCCGVRLSEACFLRRHCVDLDRGTLEIQQSKGDKDRLVFLAADVCRMCKRYDIHMDALIPHREWFFPGGAADRPFGKTSLDRKFSEFWMKTPFAGTTDRKPTIQSLRHTFVVDRMNEWMDKDVDIGVMMPYLSRYLGHSSIAETQYYYHTIERAFGAVRRHDHVSAGIIPEVLVYES